MPDKKFRKQRKYHYHSRHKRDREWSLIAWDRHGTHELGWWGSRAALWKVIDLNLVRCALRLDHRNGL